MVFHCQSCNSPIAIDETLRNLSQAQLGLLLSKSGKPAPFSKLSPPQYIPKDRLERFNSLTGSDAVISKDYSERPASYDSHQSYVYVSDDDQEAGLAADSDNKMNPNEDQLPDFSKIKTLDQVFQILLTNQDVNHPMCSECAQLLTQNYKLKFDQSQREKEYYLSFLKKLKEREDGALAGVADEKITRSARELKELHELEQTKLAELEDLEKQHEELTEKLEELTGQLAELNLTELNQIISLKNSLNLDLQVKQSKLDQAKALYNKHLNHLDRLRTLNVYTKLFDILFDQKDNYGRINGFRLGYKVPWPEVNVALGQIVLLLTFLLKRLGVHLEGYKLVPMGSQSYLVKQGKPSGGEDRKTSSVLQLYSSNEFTLGKLFNFNKVDVSMISLLDILSKFEEKLMSIDEGLAFPYTISPKRDAVGGKSIRVTSNGQWTDACRYLLIDLNWILTYASTQNLAG